MSESPAHEQRRSRAKGWVRLGLSLLVLIATLWLIDAERLWARLRTLDGRWALCALLLCWFQFLLLAARWQVVAKRLKVPLSYGRALGEYTLSTLLNQLLPLGLLGDALRAVRHRDRASREGTVEAPGARALLAILLERASGQIGLWLFVLAVAPWWWRAVLLRLSRSALGAAPGSRLLLLGAGVAVALFALVWFVRPARWLGARELVQEGVKALLAPLNLLVHLPLSLMLVVTHVGVFWLVARALGLALDPALALRIVPLVLVAATLPAFFAGWGVREAAAAGLYHLSGLSAVDGATISLVYGTIGLLASTPGIFALRRRR